MYRGPDGLRCAVGVLIPDEGYIPNMEHMSVMSSYFDRYLKSWGLSDHVLLLQDLQETHDRELPDTWSDALRNVAAHHSLDTFVLAEFE